MAYRSEEEYKLSEGGRADPLLAPGLFKMGKHKVDDADSTDECDNASEVTRTSTRRWDGSRRLEEVGAGAAHGEEKYEI